MAEEFSDKDILLVESIMKISAIERLLEKKAIISKDEIIEEMGIISKEIIKYMSDNKLDISKILNKSLDNKN